MLREAELGIGAYEEIHRLLAMEVECYNEQDGYAPDCIEFWNSFWGRAKFFRVFHIFLKRGNEEMQIRHSRSVLAFLTMFVKKSEFRSLIERGTD